MTDLLVEDEEFEVEFVGMDSIPAEIRVAEYRELIGPHPLELPEWI
jgi:hypothetical protein